MKTIYTTCMTLLIAFTVLNAFSQGNVGIGTINPVNQLQIGGTPNFSNNQFALGNGTQAMSFDQTSFATNWFSSTNFAIMPNTGYGYVGIGTQTPQSKLEVLTSDGSYGIIHTNGTVRFGTYVGSGGGWLGTQTNHPLYFFTDGSNAQVTLATNGNLGIGTTGPLNHLQIGSAPGFSANDIAIGNGTQAMSFYQSSTIANWFSNTGFSLMPVNGGSGYVGINTQSPVNKLQIGSVGASGFRANDIAFGNGTQASALAQTASTAWWYSNTNIALMPNGNGHGRVGINTLTPMAPLEVDDYVGIGYPALYAYFRAGSSFSPETGTCACTAQVSIVATSNVMAQEFDVVSDARVKDIEGISNSAEDLETLNAIQVTDYTMKDKVKNGNKQFKKVIAQQVEQVYPQIINRGSNFIPNVYRLTSKVEKTTNGVLLSFTAAHNISKDAKKLQLIDKNGLQQRVDIISVPSDKQVLINAPGLNSDTVFVYGELVNDFRTVDYEGLTTLNISATQELSKQLREQQEEIDQLKEQVAELKNIINKQYGNH